MASTELRRRLGELAQEFVDGVVKAIQTFPIQEVAGAMDGDDVRSAARRLAGSGLTAVSRGPGRRAGTRGARSGGAVRGAQRLVSARGRRPRRLVRRAGGEIQHLRDSILAALKGAPGPIGAAEIARQIGGVKTSALAFPMTQLRRQGLVHKEGERTQAVYTLGSGGGKKAGGKRGAAKKKA